jgi:serine/threonine protein kinase
MVSGKLGRYELVKRLAQGGMADLLLARTTGGGFERHLVIKQLGDDQAKDPAFVKTFVAEARRASALHHHNIVQIHDVGESGGKPYIAMEYVHGEDLRKLLARLRGRHQMLPLQHLITIGTSVAAALHHAHEQTGADKKPLGIVHGGVTPANVLVGYDGNVKLVDFGIAKAAIQAMETRSEGLEGRVPYMAPEQCTGQDVDRRSDVFALGIVLYELATGRRLFKGESQFLTMAAIVAGTVPRPSLHRKDLPGELENIILKALSRVPADRYQTAAELRTALDDFAAKVKLKGSASALAGYMTLLFGKRPEPWRNAEVTAVTVVDTAVSGVDFDGAAVGLARAPDEAIDMFAIPDGAANDSPIAHAHGRAVNEHPTVVVNLHSGKVPVLESPEPKPRPGSDTTPSRPASSTRPPRPASNTSPPRPASNTKPPRPASNTSPPRPASSTRPPRPASSTRPPRLDGAASARTEADDKSAAPTTEMKLDAASKTAGHRLPPPLRTRRSIPVTASVPVIASSSPKAAPPAVASPAAAPPASAPLAAPPPAATAAAAPSPAMDRLSTDVDENTHIANPPPPPVTVAASNGRKPAYDATQVVAPLPPPLAPVKRVPKASTPPAASAIESAKAESARTTGARATIETTGRAIAQTSKRVVTGLSEATGKAIASKRKWFVAGLIGSAAIVAVILVFAIGFSDDELSSGEVTPAEPTAAKPIVPPPEPPRPERTMRTSEPPPASDVAAPAPEEPAPEPPRPERTMRNSEPPPTSDVAVPARAEPKPEPVLPPTSVAAPGATAAPPPRTSPPPTPPVELARPKRTKPPATTHAPAQIAKPVAKPPAKPTKTPTYDPDALFLKKP